MLEAYAGTALPTAPDAERAVIAEIVRTSGEVFMDLDFLKTEHFVEKVHRDIFEAAHGIWAEGGRPDAVVLAEFFRDANIPISREALLGYCTYSGSELSVIDAARIIESKWRGREVHRIASKAAYEAITKAPGDVLDELEDSIQSLRVEQGTGLHQLLHFDGRDIRQSTGRVETGFGPLDAHLGLLRGGRLITVASRPGVGKTTLAFDIASNAAQAGKRVAAFSLEMSTDEIAERLFMKVTRIPQWKFKKPELSDHDLLSIARAAKQMANWHLYLDDTSGLSAFEIASRAKKLKHEKGLDLIVVDYVQLVSPPKADSREQEVSATVRALKHLARQLSVPVLMLSQLSRAAEVRGGKPRMSDLRESGGVENDSDQIVTLWRDDDADGRVAYTNVSIIKNRHGSVADFRMGLVREESRFDSAW